MTLEATTTHIFLNEGQARYLCDLSRVAADYRGSWESIIERGTKEIASLDANQWVTGPSHQIMAEVQQEYGKLKFALEMLWSVFRLDIFEEADRKDAAKEVEKFIEVATQKNQGLHGSLAGGTWFVQNRTIADYTKDA